jgi:hypothetical protein
MGASTGNRANMDAARRQQAMEGQAMRRRALQQQEQSAAGQEQVTPFETSAPQPGFGLEATPQPSMGRGPQMSSVPQRGRGPQMGRGPEMRSGINFGPGRANRIPDQGSPEYEQLLQRVRGLGQMRR